MCADSPDYSGMNRAAEANAEIAKQRALNVRDALVAAGIDASRIDTEKPALTTGSGDAAEARRVEVRVR